MRSGSRAEHQLARCGGAMSHHGRRHHPIGGNVKLVQQAKTTVELAILLILGFGAVAWFELAGICRGVWRKRWADWYN